MGKNKSSSFGILPILLFGGIGFFALEKGSAAQEIANNWKIAGLRVIRLNGTKLECELLIEFTNTNRQSITFDSLKMNVKYQDESIAFVNVNKRATLASGQTVIPFPVSIDLFTLIRKAVDLEKVTKLLATLSGVKDWAKWFQANLGLKDVLFSGNIIVAGVQKKIDFKQNLGNVTKAAPATSTNKASSTTNAVTS